MVGPRRTGGDQAEAAGGDLCASKHASEAKREQSRHARTHLVDALRVQVFGSVPRKLTREFVGLRKQWALSMRVCCGR